VIGASAGPDTRRELATLPLAAALAIAGIGLASGPLRTLVLLAAGIIVAITLASLPVVAVTAGLALVPLEVVHTPLPPTVSPTESCLILAAGGWLARCALTGRRPWDSLPVTGGLFLLAASIAPGVIVAPEPMLVAKSLVMWLVFFLCAQSVICTASKSEIDRLLLVAIGAGAVTAVVATVQVQAGAAQHLVDAGTNASGRATGTFTQPNTLASYLVMLLPAAIAYSVCDNRLRRWYALAAALMMVAGTAFSLSRAGLIVVAIILLATLVWRHARRAIGAALGIVAVGAALIAIAAPALATAVPQVRTVEQRMLSLRAGSQGGDLRTRIWATAPAMAENHPLFGVGTNEFPLYAPRYQLIDPERPPDPGVVGYEPVQHAHNIALTLLAERGMVGILALVVLTRGLIATWRRTPRSLPPQAFAGWGALAACGCMGLVDYPLGNNVLAALCFVAVAIVGARGRLGTAQLH
jgi:putative inorganic carbon (hco3(-)) transporter